MTLAPVTAPFFKCTVPTLFAGSLISLRSSSARHKQRNEQDHAEDQEPKGQRGAEEDASRLAAEAFRQRARVVGRQQPIRATQHPHSDHLVKHGPRRYSRGARCYS